MDNELSEKFTASFFKVRVSKLGEVFVHSSVEDVGEGGDYRGGKNIKEYLKCIQMVKISTDFKQINPLTGSK